MKKILILGASGMAGHICKNYFINTNKYTVLSTTKIGGDGNLILDAENESNIESLIVDNKPDIVINCIGILVQAAINNPISAIKVNSIFPHILEKLGFKYNFRLIHISTDCVFSGLKGSYIETDICDGYDTYARTKILGEVINEKDLTIRTSIIGPELKANATGLLDWFLMQNDTVNGYTNAFWSGITTLELAKVIEYLLNTELTGLLHVTNLPSINKYDLLILINKIWKRSVKIIPDSSKKVDKSLISLRNDFEYKVCTYETMLNDLYEYMNANINLYNKYNQ